MRKYIPSLVLAVLTFTATAQTFTYQPLVGLENSLARISYDQPGTFQKLKSVIAPVVGLRMDYRFKQGGGPYIGLTSSRPSVEYSFTNPVTGKTNFSSDAGDVQFQFQAGYQLSTKKIFLSQPSSKGREMKPAASAHKSCATSAHKSASASAHKSCATSAQKSASASAHKSCSASAPRSCGSAMSQHCGSQGHHSASRSKNSTAFMKILPSAGLAYRPFTDSKVEAETAGGKTVYSYAAGNSRMALNTGVAFEFGSGNRKNFTVSLNYFKGLGNNEQTLITAPDATKPTVMTTTKLASKSSGWNATLGFPLSFSTKRSEHHERIVNVIRHSNCSQVRRSCGSH